MYFYNILPERKLPIPYLTYSSLKPLEIGQIVKISIQSKIYYGMIIISQDEKKLDTSKIKPIVSETPFIFNHKQREFLYAFSFNTFNHLSTVFEAMIKTLQLYTEKELLQLNTKITYKPLIYKEKQSLEFFLDSYITVRIIYIIRSTLYNQENNGTILIIAPEKSMIRNLIKEFQKLAIKEGFYKDITIFNATTNSVTLIKDFLTQGFVGNTKLTIVFGTRSTLFYPINDVIRIVLLDEANSLYIQDQNSLYYDTREAAFLFSKIFNVDLTFISTLPSIRLQQFYPKEILETKEYNKLVSTLKPLKIKILKRERKEDNFAAIFNEIIDTHNGYYTEGEEE